MKKVFLTLGVAAMFTMVSCGNKNNEVATTDTAADAEAIVVEEVEETEVVMPDTIRSAAELEQALKANGWTVNDKGEIVDASGKVVKSYKEAMKEYGEKYEAAMKDYGKKVEDVAKQYGDAVEAAANTAGDKVEKAAEVAGKKADQLVNKAGEAAEKAIDQTNKKAAEIMKKAGM